jgi:hypothetical protein
MGPGVEGSELMLGRGELACRRGEKGWLACKREERREEGEMACKQERGEKGGIVI